MTDNTKPPIKDSLKVILTEEDIHDALKVYNREDQLYLVNF